MTRNNLYTIICMAFAWLVLVGGGAVWLLSYGETPSSQAHSPTLWPADTQLAKAQGRSTLLMFVHPRCACSRASIEELSRLLSHRSKGLSATIVFLQPDGVDSDWSRTSLWRDASLIPGVSIVTDYAGQLTHKFGVNTSGQTLLYNESGKLLFQGGLTPSRGHSGDSPGKTIILALTGSTSSTSQNCPATSCVYGCSMNNASLGPHSILQGR
jgi:hypothetical protein